MEAEKFIAAYNESRNGCDHFIRHPLVRSFAYTDGVQQCAEAGCYWLLDILATELPAEFVKNADVSSRCIVKVIVDLGRARILAEFIDDVVAWRKDSIATDLPDGEWTFFIEDQGGGDARYRMILLSEY